MTDLMGAVRAGLCLVVMGSMISSAQAQQTEIATVHIGSGGLHWTIHTSYDSVLLVVAGEDGVVFRDEFEKNPVYGLVDNEGRPISDGSYTYELRLTPVVDPSVQEALADARDEVDTSDPGYATELAREFGLPAEAEVVSGYFRVLNGSAVTDSTELSSLGAPSAVTSGAPGDSLEALQVIADDLTVQGSACIGVDCTSSESFGFDTLRLKENNLRIKFMDTSASGSFPTVDWQLTANDSSNGGANKFSIDDIDNGRTPFTITAAAPSNSIFVDSQGDVGFGTAVPVVELHSKDGDSPALRLEQDGSSGFTPQTWDVAGNEANFFVRDVTNGSKLPFKIRPNAGDDSIVIAAGGVGLGTDNPQDLLHLANGTVRVEATDGSTPALRFVSAGQSWLFENDTDSGIFSIRDETKGTAPLRVLPGGVSNTLVVADGRVGVGTANPNAKLDVTGPIIQRGGVLQADYVFEPGYELESIEEHAEFMWRERHLPSVPAMEVDANGEEIVEIGAQRRGILEELEKAHIYIERLNATLRDKQERIEGLESENAAILSRLQKIEALLGELEKPIEE